MQESKDGRYTFVTVNNGIAVLRNGSGQSLTLLRTVPVPGADKGLVLTGDGRYLIAAGGRGAVVVGVAAAEQGAAQPVRGTLASPDGDGAVGVQVSPNDQFVFVTLENSTTMAVFNLGLALKSGFGPADFVGSVPLGVEPTGVRVSPDGKWLYATSFRRTPGDGPGEGTLSVISMSRAETTPKTSVESTVDAGCTPARIVTDGSTVWVTARDSNALLAFSASKLLDDRSHALIADVHVGQQPIGLTLAAGGKRLIIVDSKPPSSTQGDGDLAVINVSDALAGKPALLGVVPAGGQPHQLTLSENGSTLLVTNQITGQLQAIKIADLP